MLTTIKKFLPVIGLLLLSWILFKIDFKQVVSIVAEAKLDYLLLSLLFLSWHFFFHSYKWHVVITKKIKFSLWKTLNISMISMFVNLITPTGVSTLFRSHLLKKESDHSYAMAAATVATDKFLELFLLIIFIVASVILVSSTILSDLIYPVLMIVVIVSSTIAWSITDKIYGKRFVFFILSLIDRIPRMKKLSQFGRDLYDYLDDLPELIIPIIMNIAYYACSYIAIYFLSLSLGINISLLQLIFSLQLITLASQLPISVAGIGTREATAIYIWGLYGISAEATLAVSLLSFVLTKVVPGIIGFILFYIHPRRESLLSFQAN